MITRGKNYTKINTKIRNNQSQTANPKCTRAPRVHYLSFGMIRCLFRYSTDAGYKLIVGIYSPAAEATQRNFLFSSSFAQTLRFSFGLGPTCGFRLPSGICSLPI